MPLIFADGLPKDRHIGPLATRKSPRSRSGDAELSHTQNAVEDTAAASSRRAPSATKWHEEHDATARPAD